MPKIKSLGLNFNAEKKKIANRCARLFIFFCLPKIKIGAPKIIGCAKLL